MTLLWPMASYYSYPNRLETVGLTVAKRCDGEHRMMPHATETILRNGSGTSDDGGAPHGCKDPFVWAHTNGLVNERGYHVLMHN